MKKIITLLAFTISFIMNAQMSDNSYDTSATGAFTVAMGYQTEASGTFSTAMGRGTTASGYTSTAMGLETTASGDYSTAMGRSTDASGNRSTAMGNNTTASGYESTAMGESTLASGSYSTAMGYITTASGDDSTAMGNNTTASGNASTALGRETTASGYTSTAMGRETTASDYASLVIGQYNLLGSTLTYSNTQFSAENTAFVIGNGADADNRTDALTVLFDGTTNVAGSVTATSFIGDGSQLTNLPSSSPFSLNTTSGNGIQSSTNIASGDFSTAMGRETTASGSYSTAMGRSTEASGYASTAMGRETTASGNLSTALGYQTTASGYTSTAMGYGTDASGWYSTAMGISTEASGESSTAMGYRTTASEYDSTAMGNNTTASGSASTAMGNNTTASGDASTAMGASTTASDYGSLVIGQYNLLGSTVTNSSSGLSTENTAFVIGNGADADNRSDALTVLFDGTTTIAGDLSINSDARLKANIISLGSTLAKVLQIDGKSYTMKKDENNKQKIGLLAQDIEKVFPELVSESNGVKSVNYQGLVPVLINALKEQDAKMNEQQTEIDELKEMVQALVSRE